MTEIQQAPQLLLELENVLLPLVCTSIHINSFTYHVHCVTTEHMLIAHRVSMVSVIPSPSYVTFMWQLSHVIVVIVDNLRGTPIRKSI